MNFLHFCLSVRLNFERDSSKKKVNGVIIYRIFEENHNLKL